MCQGVVPTCQQTSCSPSQKPSGNFSVYQRERESELGQAEMPGWGGAATLPTALPWPVPMGKGWVPLTEDAVLMDFTAASNTFFGSLRLVVPLSTMLLS